MSEAYLAQATTMAIVNSPIVVSSTLWPQRAMSPSMVKSPVKFQMMQLGAWQRFRCPYFERRTPGSFPGVGPGRSGINPDNSVTSASHEHFSTRGEKFSCGDGRSPHDCLALNRSSPRMLHGEEK
jgi:hypothetical protein